MSIISLSRENMTGFMCMLLHGDCTGATIMWSEKNEVLYDSSVYDGLTKVIMDEMTRQMLMNYTHDTVEYLLHKAVSFTIKLYLYHSQRREVCIKYDPVDNLITTVFEPITFNHNYKLNRFEHLDAPTLKERLSLIYHEHFMDEIGEVTIPLYEPFRRVTTHRLPSITRAHEGIIPYISVSLNRVQSCFAFEDYIRSLMFHCCAVELIVSGKENEILYNTYSDGYTTVCSQKMKNFIYYNIHVLIRSNMLNHEDSTLRLYIGPVYSAIAVDLSVHRRMENVSYDISYWVAPSLMAKPNMEEYMERNLHHYMDMSYKVGNY